MKKEVLKNLLRTRALFLFLISTSAIAQYGGSYYPNNYGGQNNYQQQQYNVNEQFRQNSEAVNEQNARFEENRMLQNEIRQQKMRESNSNNNYIKYSY